VPTTKFEVTALYDYKQKSISVILNIDFINLVNTFNSPPWKIPIDKLASYNMTESSFGLNCSCINDFARLYLFILENLSLGPGF
jgi:hypothetical protein